MSVKSVYNFVPAPKEKEVFKPEWAEQVSHDIPFSDGESGEIELKITAETPIFIRDGHAQGKETNEFFHYKNSKREKQYYIPGSSLKGMFRNVLEIMSFARLETKDDIFAFRNLKHKNYADKVMKNRSIKTGWLMKENDRWIIKECDHKRIAINDIERKFTDVSINGKSAVEKYKAYNRNDAHTVYFNKNLGLKIKDSFIKTGELYQFETNQKSDFKGKLVFYGSMDNKKYEYVFGEAGKAFRVSEDLMKRFIEIEKKKNNDDKQEDSLFYYLREKKEKIPVFYYAKGDEIEHFGFSKLYKLPNVNRVSELNPIKTYPEKNDIKKPDLAEVIFGGTEINNKDNLKGRVYFGHAYCKTAVEHKGKPISVVLNSPKASYFPFYLRNKKTYLDSDAELSGFKKYPVHTDIKSSKLNDENQSLISQFLPLKEGSEFIARVRFHNLKKEEIGALLSSITFHGNTDNFSHNIGGAKPLGYGKIKVTVEKISNLKSNQNNYLYAYEEMMNKHIEKSLGSEAKGWLKTDQVIKLLAMSQSSINKFQNNSLIYPEIEAENQYAKGKQINEFQEYESLPSFESNFQITSIASKDEGIMEDLFERQEDLEKEISTKERFKDLKDFLKEKKEEIVEFSPKNKRLIINQIKRIYLNHKSSQRKLKKNYEWENTVPDWLGKELTQTLKKDLPNL